MYTIDGTIEGAAVHWGRYLRFGAVPMTSVRAFTLFKYAIKVTGAAPSFAAMHAPFAPLRAPGARCSIAVAPAIMGVFRWSMRGFLRRDRLCRSGY